MIELNAKVKAWTEGVPFEYAAQEQVSKLAELPVVKPHVAVMPDVQFEVHGATVGTVIPTIGAIIPAAVGVDIGCGVAAVKTTLLQTQLPESLKPLYRELEVAVPVGRDDWKDIPFGIETAFLSLVKSYHELVTKHPFVDSPKVANQLGTLGSGNHFVEISVDTDDYVWVMIHTGSRNAGHRIGSYFIEKAKEGLEQMGVAKGHLPHPDLAYLLEGEPIFKDYVKAVSWAQEYATVNRRVMINNILSVMHLHLPPFTESGPIISCHHNYVVKEKHFGKDMWITRKGAIYAGQGAKGIIPGSMGSPSFIVEGLGNPLSFNSSSHGAGRFLSRGEAKTKISTEQLRRDTEDIECRKDAGVLDEAPAAYKNIHDVMAAQSDLVRPVAELHPVLVLKG